MNQNQQKILELIKQKDISGMSFRAIGRELDIPNPQTVIYHIKKLKDKGLLYFDTKNRQRVSKPKAFLVDKLFNIPILGSANCGPAMELAQEDVQGYLKISQKLVKKTKPDGLIAIKAVGESLNNANIEGDSIEDGDYVIVDCKKEPQNSDYVLSIIDEAANFKQFFKDKKKKEIRLVSNSTIDIAPIVLHEQDIETSNYRVNGVVVRVVKS
jgi:SOS-response transcriptional repressor LexA